MKLLNDTLTEQELETYREVYRDEILDQMWDKKEEKELVVCYDTDELDLYIYEKEDGTNYIIDTGNDMIVVTKLMSRKSPVDNLPEYKIV